jgi:hypothetical protein
MMNARSELWVVNCDTNIFFKKNRNLLYMVYNGAVTKENI